LSSTPNRRKDLVVSDLEDGQETVFLDVATDKVVSLNPTATAIWYLCDGQRTVEDIVDEVASVQPRIDRARLEQDVASTLKILSEHQLLVG
jgi:hypothetical protein